MRKLKGKMIQCYWCLNPIYGIGIKMNVSQKYFIIICSSCNNSKTNATNLIKNNIRRPYQGGTGSKK